MLGEIHEYEAAGGSKIDCEELIDYERKVVARELMGLYVNCAVAEEILTGAIAQYLARRSLSYHRGSPARIPLKRSAWLAAGHRSELAASQGRCVWPYLSTDLLLAVHGCHCQAGCVIDACRSGMHEDAGRALMIWQKLIARLVEAYVDETGGCLAVRRAAAD